MLKTNTLKLNNDYLLVAISKETNETFNKASDKVYQKEIEWLTENNFNSSTLFIFNDNYDNVKEFFKKRNEVNIYKKGLFKLTDFVEAIEDKFKNYNYKTAKADADWASDIIALAGGSNPKVNFYLADKEFYSNPEVIEEMRKHYPIKNVVNTAYESFLSAIKTLVKETGFFALIKT